MTVRVLGGVDVRVVTGDGVQQHPVDLADQVGHDVGRLGEDPPTTRMNIASRAPRRRSGTPTPTPGTKRGHE